MTKARTKAKKRNIRRGRPKDDNVEREPNGRASRSGRESPDSVALEARMRRYGITKEQAKDQKASTFVGYLNLLGRRDGLSDDQYAAAQNYLKLRADYHRSIKAPDAMLHGAMGGSSGDEISEGYIDWCDTVRERYKDCRSAVQDAQNASRENLWAALDYCVVRDERHDHLVPALRLALNALARFFESQLDGCAGRM